MRVILSWSKDRRRDCQIWLCEEHDFKVCNISWVWGPSINDVGKLSEFWHPPPQYRQVFSTIRRQFWPIFDPSQLPASLMNGHFVSFLSTPNSSRQLHGILSNASSYRAMIFELIPINIWSNNDIQFVRQFFNQKRLGYHVRS